MSPSIDFPLQGDEVLFELEAMSNKFHTNNVLYNNIINMTHKNCTKYLPYWAYNFAVIKYSILDTEVQNPLYMHSKILRHAKFTLMIQT